MARPCEPGDRRRGGFRGRSCAGARLGGLGPWVGIIPIWMERSKKGGIFVEVADVIEKEDG